MAELIQSAKAYEPRLRVMMFAVDWPVNWAKLATPLGINQSRVNDSQR